MAGQMYDPALRRALLDRLAHWDCLPLGDLVQMLSPVERLRYRDDALLDLAWAGLVEIRLSGDECMVSITDDGRRSLADPASLVRATGRG